MLVIPAIDLKDGMCVRLKRGQMKDLTVYSDDPAGTAREWEGLGAEFLHVVDLDGAMEGEPRNTRSIEAILNAVRIPVEIGGGIRTAESVEKYLTIGVRRVVLGTRAFEDPAFVREACRAWSDRVVLSVDTALGRIAVKGWTSVTREDAVAFVKKFEDAGIAAIIYTDIERDGTLSGMNYDGVEAFARQVGIPVIASGGVASLRDIRELKARERSGIAGVIVGKALYSGAVDLAEAVAIGRGS